MKAVVFDMDGVLIDSEPANLKIIYDFFKEHDKHAETDFLLSLVGRSQHDTADIVLDAWGENISFDEYCTLYQAYRDTHPIDYQEILFPGVEETLAWLKKAGYLVAVASSSKMRTIEKVLTQTKLLSYFDVCMSGEMFEKSKPDPEIYIRTAEKLGVDVKDCLAIEDSKAGLASACASGMKVAAKVDLRFGADPSVAHYQIQQLLDIKTILQEQDQ